MGFSRAVPPVSPPEADTLTEDMAGIGMNLGGRANHRANIENTLFFASEEEWTGPISESCPSW